MARRSYAGIIGAGMLAVGVLGFMGQANAAKLQLGADTWLTTDYEFRGITQTQHNPAIQGEFSATYGNFYADIWASSLDFGAVDYKNTDKQIAPLEIDYYGGWTPTWNGISFDLGVLGYTYPDARGDLNVFELKAGGSKSFMNDKLSVSYTTYYSPGSQYWVFEGDGGYTFNKVSIFTPTLSGGVGGYAFVGSGNSNSDYTYWNVGLTLATASKYSFDIRYWDTNFSKNGCSNFAGYQNACDARVVGTLSASF